MGTTKRTADKAANEEVASTTTATKKPAKRRRAQNYLNNKRLLEHIGLSKERWEEAKASAPDPECLPSAAECMTPELVKMIMMLVDRYGQRANWRGYTYIEDMKSEATLSLLNGTLKFNPEKSVNPFGYMTQIVTHSFLTTLDKEGKVRRIRDDILEQFGFDPSNTRQIENEHAASMQRRLISDKIEGTVPDDADVDIYIPKDQLAKMLKKKKKA